MSENDMPEEIWARNTPADNKDGVFYSMKIRGQEDTYTKYIRADQYEELQKDHQATFEQNESLASERSKCLERINKDRTIIGELVAALATIKNHDWDYHGMKTEQHIARIIAIAAMALQKHKQWIEE